MINDLQKTQFLSLIHDWGKLIVRAKDKTYFNHEMWSRIIGSRIDGLDGLSEMISDDKVIDNIPLLLTKIGDKLAAFERERKDDKTNPKETPLGSIFNHISLDDKPKVDDDYSFTPTEFNPIKIKLPVKTDELNIDDIRKGFKELMDKFIKSIEEINQKTDEKNFDELFFKLYFISKRFLFFVPSASFIHKPSISLFDHSRITSAIATSLYKELEFRKELNLSKVKEINNDVYKIFEIINKEGVEESKRLKEAEEIDINNKEPLFLLIHGDLSGIQRFIFTIKSKGALKTIRGRSAFLSILNLAITYHVINELGLNVSNIIYSGGGHFYILAPVSYEDKLNKIKERINSLLYKNFGLSLYLCLGGARLGIKDFLNNKINNKWSEVSEKTNEQKRTKFKELFKEEFFIKENKPRIDSCSVCNKYIPFDKKKTEEGVNYCPNCYSFKEFGKKTVSIREFKTSELRESFTIIKELNLKDYQFNLSTNTVKEPFIMFPTNRKGLNDFESLIKDKNGGYIGFLKMDVDSLGLIFIKGLKNKSLSSMASLSSLLTLFFKGYINEIIKEYDNIRVIFSGGDDVFVIGWWDELLRFAKEFNEEFRAFTSNNKDVHMSAGFIITHHKFPVSEGAMIAEELLEESKDNEGKNRITLLKSNINSTLKWGSSESDFNQVYNYWIKLKDEVEDKDKKMSRGFLNRLIKSNQRFIKELRRKNVPAIWRLKYYLARSDKKSKVAHEIINEIDEIIKNKLRGKDEGNLMVFALSARLAEISTKSVKIKNKEVE